MRGKWLGLSRPQRMLTDLLHFASKIPTVPVQRRISLAAVAAARNAVPVRPCWPALFLKAYGQVADETPALRRAYFGLPWPHLREYPSNVASIAIEREYDGEPCVFFGQIPNPGQMPLADIHSRIRQFAEAPIESVRSYRRMLNFARLPRLIRRSLFGLALQLPRSRPGMFGTFGLSVYSSLGAESLHPLSPLTTTMNYGVIEPNGTAWARLVYDHRVFSGATAARALGRLEEVMNDSILAELRSMTHGARAAA